jgi:hypothetical protein
VCAREKGFQAEGKKDEGSRKRRRREEEQTALDFWESSKKVYLSREMGAEESPERTVMTPWKFLRARRY